jgi:hypothetical protein
MQMKKILALCLLFVTASAFAENWVRYAKNQDALLYYDKHRKVVMSGTAFIWDLHDLKVPATDAAGNSYQSVLYATEYNCRKEQRRILSVQWMAGKMGNGPVVAEDAMVSDWKSDPLGTPAATLLDVACENN